MSRLKIIILGAVILLFITACGKSVDDQVMEQLELGQKYLLELDYEAAMIAFQKVIELDPKVEEAYVYLSQIFEENENYDEAIEILNRGLISLPDSSNLSNRLEELSSEVLISSNEWSQESGETYSIEEMLNLIADQTDGELDEPLVADFNGDGKDEIVVHANVIADNENPDFLRHWTIEYWYTDGEHTYCYDTREYWWPTHYDRFLVETEDGIHLAETQYWRQAADGVSSTIFKFTEKEAENLFDTDELGKQYAFLGSENGELTYDFLEPEDPLNGLLYLKTVSSGVLIYKNGSYVEQ